MTQNVTPAAAGSESESVIRRGITGKLRTGRRDLDGQETIILNSNVSLKVEFQIWKMCIVGCGRRLERQVGRTRAVDPNLDNRAVDPSLDEMVMVTPLDIGAGMVSNR